MCTSMHAKQRSSDCNTHRVASSFVLDAIPPLYPYVADCCLLLYQYSKYHVLLLKLMSSVVFARSLGGVLSLEELSPWCSCLSHSWRHTLGLNSRCSAWFDPGLAPCVEVYYTMCALSALGLNYTYSGTERDVFGCLPFKQALVMFVQTTCRKQPSCGTPWHFRP